MDSSSGVERNDIVPELMGTTTSMEDEGIKVSADESSLASGKESDTDDIGEAERNQDNKVDVVEEKKEQKEVGESGELKGVVEENHLMQSLSNNAVTDQDQGNGEVEEEKKQKESRENGIVEGAVGENQHQNDEVEMPQMQSSSRNAVTDQGQGNKKVEEEKEQKELLVREDGKLDVGIKENQHQNEEEEVPEMQSSSSLDSTSEERDDTDLNKDEKNLDAVTGSDAKESSSDEPQHSTSDTEHIEDENISVMHGAQSKLEEDIENNADDEDEKKSNHVEEVASDSKDIGSVVMANQGVAETSGGELGTNIEASALEEEHDDTTDEEENESVPNEEHEITEVYQSHQLLTTEDTAYGQVGVEEQGDESLESGTAMNQSPLSSGQSSANSTSDSASTVEEDMPTKFSKQIAVMKIKNILLERGERSLQVLNSILGEKLTKEDRGAVGWKADEVLQTLTQFKDVFSFESRPDIGGTLHDQQYISVDQSSEETSLAFARTILRIPKILKKKGNLTVAQLSTFLNEASTVEERLTVGRGPPLLKETLLSLPAIFQVSNEEVSVIKQIKLANIENQASESPSTSESLNDDSSTHVSSTSESMNDDSSSQVSATGACASAGGDEVKEIDISKQFALQLGVLKIKRILEEKGNVAIPMKILSAVFGGRGTKEEREAVGKRAIEMLDTITKFDDVFLWQTIPGKGEEWIDAEFISLKNGKDKPTSLVFVNTVFKLSSILKKGSLTINQLSTALNQTSTVDERNAVGRSPSTLKETLLALPEVFCVMGNTVSVIKSAKDEDAQTLKPKVEAAAPNISKEFDATFVYKQLGVLRIKEILQGKGRASLQKLCSDFGKEAGDDEREAVGWRAMVVLETLREYPDIFEVVSPKVIISVQSVTEQTTVCLKRGVKDKPSVPFSRGMFKLIWFLKQKGTLSVPHLCSLFGQNSTLVEREVVGKNPGALKAILKALPKMFKVSADNVSVVERAHIHAIEQFVICVEMPTTDLKKIPEKLQRNVVATVSECLQSRGGSCDVTKLTEKINNSGSQQAREMFGNSGSALLKVLKSMPNLFSCQGSKVFLKNMKSSSSPTVTQTLGASNVNMTQIPNPIPVQGLLPTSQAKVIPSIEIVFDTKNTGDRGWWGDISVSQAAATTVQSQVTSSSVMATPPPLMSMNPHSTNDQVRQFYMERAAHKTGPSLAAAGAPQQLPSAVPNSKKTTKTAQAMISGLKKITACLEQCKIATIIQIGGILGSKGTAAERNAVGKNPSLLYDTMSSLPDKFVISGPFIGVQRHCALVTGISKLVTYLESKGKCELNSLLGRLGQCGRADERSAVGKDLQTFTQTISDISGVFIIEGTTVYLNNGMNGTPCTPTPMNKTTAVTTQNSVPWALSAGTVWNIPSSEPLPDQNSKTTVPVQPTTSHQQTYASVTDPTRPSFSVTVVSINNHAMCQEFVDQCLAKYEYPIISLAVNKKQKWIAIAGWEDHVYLFHMEGAATTGGYSILADVMASSKILKVVHNCQYSSSVLYECYGMKLGNIFDTKVAYQLLTGESTITFNELCKEYGVVQPDQWNVILSDRAASVANTDIKPRDLKLATFARVLIPQIYQHMVMKFSGDSLQEVGKLCEAFLHQEETRSQSASTATTAATTASQHVTNGLDNSTSEASSDLPTVPTQSSQASAVQQEGDMMISSETTHSKVPTPVLNPWGITQQLRDQFEYRNKHDMDKLLAVLGEDITRNLTKLDQNAGIDCGLALLGEVVLDCGRCAQARFYQRASPNRNLDVDVSSSVITQENIQAILDNDWVSTPTTDKRTGIEDTLHRLGIITNRKGRAIGLTTSVGRAVLGCVDHISDLFQDGQSVVMLGRPGIGMTTVLREIARVLSDTKKRRVIIIDTYNQIGGDSDTPHPAIGSARRLQVASRADQYQTMMEAVQNHTPQTIIIDEIATAPEAQAVRKLVQRGVQVITTAHSCNFVDFYRNPEFKHVTGMVQDAAGGVELGDGSKKTASAFQTLIELCDRDRWIVHKDFGLSVDLYLQGMRPIVQERQQTWDDKKGSHTSQHWMVKLIEAPLPSL
ncbi:uncharacterized protein [Amphiura filiformis]|uniref:uncharacterized protein n=1 Tax=Amphiura filiformis TaxID=82378 RepID=UPI003B2216FB